MNEDESLADRVRARTGVDTVTIMETAYSITALPADDPEVHHWTLHVKRFGADRWSLGWGGRSWNFTTGEWQPTWGSPSVEDLCTDLDTALARAAVLAPVVSVNGKTAAQLLAWRAEQ